MSRIGNRKLLVPANVTVSVDGNVVTVKGPKGELSTEIHKGINVAVEENEVVVTRENDSLMNFHGTVNANNKNIIVGVTEGYVKNLEAVRVGYRFNVAGNTLTISAGYSHPVKLNVPAGLTVEAVSNTEISIKGIDKCLVGEFAANVRKVREPEPYKGKGIRYKEEHIRRKEGKKAA